MEIYKEIYTDIIGYEGLYQISNFGNVRSCGIYNNTGFKPVILKQIVNCKGYYFVKLSNKCKKKTFRVHKLVAFHFINNPLKKRCVNHIDLNKLNNHVSNLEWVTHKENSLHYHLNKKKEAMK